MIIMLPQFLLAGDEDDGNTTDHGMTSDSSEILRIISERRSLDRRDTVESMATGGEDTTSQDDDDQLQLRRRSSAAVASGSGGASAYDYELLLRMRQSPTMSQTRDE